MLKRSVRTEAVADGSKNANWLELWRLVSAVIVLIDHTFDVWSLLKMHLLLVVGKVKGESCGQGSDLKGEGMDIVHFPASTKRSAGTVKGPSCMMMSQGSASHYVLMAAKEGVAVALSRGAHCMLEAVHRRRSGNSVNDADTPVFALIVDSMLIDLKWSLRYQNRLLTVYP